ncbi:transcriptional regulator [Lactiplantibacillus paraplantarum]|uniref:Transcriptional regulator n=1 Tax=Lactiplantibacillus paraplantarum TaxID=60520 RepID=A0ABQ0NAU6_9LACO|nr:helix-turn-helix transcriptional regulator [Lactiplantibacillus paraplantarum]GBF02176.1 transcriptional regulator [Lactiplantibacillus paraplantarum]
MIGSEIKKIRSKLGWTQAKLADAAGVSQSTVNTLENRTKHPDAVTLNLLAKAMGVTVDDLLEPKEVPK